MKTSTRRVALYCAFTNKDNALSWMRFNNKTRPEGCNTYFLLKREVSRAYSDVKTNGYVMAKIINY